MPSTRAIVTYRPDTDEERLIALLSRKTGLNKSRLLGLALRQMAEREGIADAPPVGRTNPEVLEEMFGVFADSPHAREVLDTIAAERERADVEGK